MDKSFQIADEWVNVSHGKGVPFGGLGTGYGMFGRFGWCLPNFDSNASKDKYPKFFQRPETYDYLHLYGDDASNFLRLCFVSGGKTYLFQGELPLPYQQENEKSNEMESSVNLPDEFASYEFLPFSLHLAQYKQLGLYVKLLAFSPLIPYDIKNSSVPVWCMEFELENKGEKPITADFTFIFSGTESNTFVTENGTAAAAFDDLAASRRVVLAPGAHRIEKAYLAWYYPRFTTPSEFLTDEYTRYYTLSFTSAEEVIWYAAKHVDEWKESVTAWQESLDFPPAFKRLWFSSLSSVITSTMLADDHTFFEIEDPHPFMNTFDVTIYSSWLYMIYWPQLEEHDMKLHCSVIADTGENKGFVYHSLWSDACDYVEEPCFVERMYRDYLWFNKKSFLEEKYHHIVNAAQRVYENNSYADLIASEHGNQSYDNWKMPGVSAYVNLPWMYALYSLTRISALMKKPILIGGKSPEAILENAVRNFERFLWNGEYYNCFYRTPGAAEKSVQESVFTDHLFGRWVLLTDRRLQSLLPIEHIKSSVLYAYKNNLIDEPEKNFRGWANGMLPGGKPTEDLSQYHARTCWIGGQLSMGSVLGELGFEEEALDVFRSVEGSLANNHLAVGEWNRSVAQDGTSEPLERELAKDTPRFPAYPRYKVSWEYLIRLIGLKLDEKYLELRPFKNISFEIKHIVLAESELSIKVKKNWKVIKVNNVITSGMSALVPRNENSVYRIIFE